MGKIYTFINLILPLLGLLLILQLILLAFSREVRVKVNFGIFSLLAISTIRPNILGESFGLISPLYFFTLVYLSKLLSPDYRPNSKAVSRARNGLFAMFLILFLNWLSKAVIASGNSYNFDLWPPIANLLTVGISCFCLLQLLKLGTILRFFKVFLYLLLFQACFGLISKFVLNHNFCIDFNAGRGWNYSLCAPGAVFASQNRLTGIAGEPSIFVVYLAVAAILFWWPQLHLGVLSRCLFSAICIWASMVSGATTGAIVGLLALTLIPFQRTTFKNGHIVLIFYSVLTYTSIQTRFVQNYVEEIFSDKKKTNLGSIFDRNLNLGLGDYLTRWQEKPFGSRWGVGGTPYSSGINLLAESIVFGPLTIFLMIALVFAANILSLNLNRTLSIGLIVFIVCLTLQPAWPNAFWFLLLYLVLLVDQTTDSSAKEDEETPLTKT
jgi:hypothetical protein